MHYVNSTDTTCGDGPAAPTARYERKPVTPSAAVIYQPIEPVSVYPISAKSLEQGGSAPQAAVNAYQTFAPTTSKHSERVPRWNSAPACPTLPCSVSISACSQRLVQSEQTRCQGIGLPSQMTLADHWTLPGSVMLPDARNLRAAEGVDGNRACGAPRVAGNRAWRTPCRRGTGRC